MGISCAVCCAYWLAQSRGDFRVPADSFCFRTTTSTRHGFPVCACLSPGVILTIAYIIRERKAAFDIFKSTRDFFGIILFAIFGVGLCQYAYLEAIIIRTRGCNGTAVSGTGDGADHILCTQIASAEVSRDCGGASGGWRYFSHRNAWKYPSDEYLERGTEVGIACGVWVLHVYPASGADAKKMGQSAGRWLWHADLWRGI